MRFLRSLRQAVLVLGVVVLLVLAALPTGGASAAPVAPPAPVVAVPTGASLINGRVCFPETGYCAENAFLDFWRTNGGVEILGYPIDEPRRFPDGLIRQFYERAILEWHPANEAQYQVLLTRLGAALIDGSPRTADAPQACGQDCTLFPETNHTLRGPFADYWNRYGGLPVFGLPLTEEFIEISPTNGQPYLVQYFERNRFEYHPENRGRFRVLLGLLGGETLRALEGEIRSRPKATVPNYGAGATVPQIAALPREGAVGKTFVFIFAGLRPNTEYAILIATNTSPAQRVVDGTFRANGDGVLAVEFDSSSTPPGSYLIGAFDGNGRLVISTDFALFFVPGS